MTAPVIIAGIGILALLAFIIMRVRSKRDADHKKISSTKSIPQAATEASQKAPAITQEPIQVAIEPEQEQKVLIEDLSQSGAITIGAEVTRCIAAEKWDEAIKWLLHATDSLPDSDEFKVTLAEVYAKAGEPDNFIPLFEKLYVDLPDNSEHKKRLMTIARAFVPDHRVFQA